MDFAITADHKEKIKGSEKIDKYLDLSRRQKKAVEYEVDSDPDCSWYTWNGP